MLQGNKTQWLNVLFTAWLQKVSLIQWIVNELYVLLSIH